MVSPSSVSGTVVDGSGQPIAIGGSVIVRPIVKELAAIGIGMPSGTGLKPDRTFQLMLPPGEYELEAHASLTRANGSPAPGSELFGSVRVNIAGPVTGISISLGLAAKVSGRVVFEGTTPAPTFTMVNGPGTIAFTPTDGSPCRAGRCETAPNWTFTIDGVSGTCIARFYGGIPRWYLMAIRHSDTDLMDQPVTFTPGQHMRGVEV